MPRLSALPRSTLAAAPLLAACSDSTSATSVTLTVGQPMMNGMEQDMDPHQGGITGPVVPMRCAWRPDQTLLTCTPVSSLPSGTQFTIHVGAGMTDARHHMMDMDEWTGMGGQWATSGRMGGMHDGQMVGMMGSGWKQGNHSGLLFSFTTT